MDLLDLILGPKPDPLGADLDDIPDNIIKMIILAARGNPYAIHALSAQALDPDFEPNREVFKTAFAATRRARERINHDKETD